MLKFLFVISFGFGIPTKYSDWLKHFFFELVQSWCAIFLDWGPACMSLLSWNPGSMKQRCAGISSVSWPCFEITWSRIGYYSVLWSENNMNTVYIYIYTRYIRIYIQLFCTFLHLWAFSTLTDSSLDGTIETMETPWSESKALGALHSRAGIPSH